jgi:photosystem II stability/assembly factor-like uncharacterized protein
MKRIMLAACLVAAMTLAACAQQAGGSPGAHSPLAHPARTRVVSAARAQSGERPAVAGVMDLVGPQTGVVGLYVPSGTGRSAHFVITRNGGRTFRPFGPAASNQDIPDSVFFLHGVRDGWLLTFPGGGGHDIVYRTRNGGRSWQQFTAPEHVLAAGSTDLVQFVSATSGWMTDIQPTGPAETLLQSTDGGANWRCVVSVFAANHGCPGRLPELGPVRFERGAMIGWLGGGQFSTALYRTADGGRTWERMHIPAPRNAIFGLPAVFGRTIIETATAAPGHAASLLTFVSRDNGASWQLGSALDRPGISDGCAGPASASFPSASAGWAAAFQAGRLTIYRRTAPMRPWRIVAQLGRRLHAHAECVQIQAAGSAHAWLQVASDAGIEIYATSDGGRSWHRIDQAAEAAGR